MNKPVIILGDGGHASVLAEILLLEQRNVLGYTSPEPNKVFFSLNYLGADEAIRAFDPSEVELVLGLGSVNLPYVRSTIFQHFKMLGYTFVTVIHPSAIIAPSAKVEEGCQIMAGSIMQTNSVIEENVILNTGTKVDHDCSIGCHSHIAPGVTISGGVQIGDTTHIGTGATIIQGIKIGSHVLIGAGSVVINDIADGKTVYGVPAKEAKQ
ncbi:MULTISPECIES: acetyltransferase [Sporosarcina]|uniref:UDP-perosamine 4-acetyltransferase n=1 Tax=Sporosarcina newyorkensis TaxID=759851 RepID=A0A1T4Y1J4_9BACL|nr:MULTISPECIES: acetyltransferase [Sporosarcina]MBY0223489.1 acetyltransferase [Sporosarcina aquimarina]SKA95687.1 UDP-perosamine 4-acetyltransferase [Sporosarcina newyorkensis]